MATQTETVRLGVVGLGFMGQTHATNATDLGHEVVAGADVVPETREEFAQSFGATTYEDVAAMYDEEALDAVAVSTPNAFHEDAVVAALERGYDVLCEKPLANDLASAERIAAAAADSDGFCMVNFHNRISTATEVFKDYQREGHFGEITHVDANYVRRRGIPGVGSWFTEKALSGGGAVVDIGVHAIDFALYLMDYPDVEDVFAVTRTEFGHREDYVDPGDWYDETEDAVFDVEDSATAMIRCADDRTISLEVTWAANQPGTQEFVARGTEAGATLDLGGEELTMFQSGTQGTDHTLDVTLSDGAIDRTGWEGSDERFLEAVAAGEAPELNTVDQGLTVQRVIDAIYRSAEAGTSVSVE
ncbi:Gfo/Idh/MocA family oxidoreductase [Natronolimnobius sp. AArcel1]|uniref:Gfo/Idh/MocA family protein n=1 Tax=Natronolimnobius sp. AArcel1 TaxID=1679093 RepID=UPI0013ECFAE2|nr:Gfo/Idh/MocA family oxidoreductase [Natronolimnobius sp. AArcel1]NGM68082.1 Gfo/Idh/MocA family oxidoreductase [Natronolimnobius sp. AArcel1]